MTILSDAERNFFLAAMNKRYLFTTLFLLVGMFLHLKAEETEPNGVLEGVIVVSPASAGPAIAGAATSAPLANVDFQVKKMEAIVASFTTDNQGRFRVSLPPGHYVISLKEGTRRRGHYGPFEVDVVAGQTKHVEWTCDIGLR
jgi:hypothetical protein